jgi:DNA repair exonuclease SbcCD nuclease subunit|tara:strand:+ start:8977 stop:9936 length:960 start_codon:yes stop_codon:yes gene_type:complete
MILFTADWHIKLGQKNVPVSWALDRYKLFFEQIYSLEKMCNMHIIGGDLFDRLPNMEELELYFSFIRGVSIPTLIYDGNHEATKKNKTFFTQLKQASRDINPLVQIVDISYRDSDFGFGVLPYADLHRKGSIEKFIQTEPLFTHVRGEIPPHVKPEVDLDRFEEFPIVFAGDLHAHSNTQRNIVYPGSPMTTSFHRTNVTTGYLLINPDDWSWIWEPFDLPQLIRKTVSSTEEMIPTDYDHTIYEIEGDIQELADVKNSELLDKKVVRRNSEAALLLDKEMTIQEELTEYLQFVLEIEEARIPDIIGTFNDYASKVAME